MKIYLTNILPSSLMNKLTKLTNTFGNPIEKIKYSIYSEECGIYEIKDKNVFRIEPTFSPDYEIIKNFNKNNLLVDKTKYTLIPIISQLPVKYIISKYYEYEFKLTQKSNLSLVIRCFQETHNYEKVMIPFDFYFIYKDENLDLNNVFFKEDFNVFLSQLN